MLIEAFPHKIPGLYGVFLVSERIIPLVEALEREEYDTFLRLLEDWEDLLTEAEASNCCEHAMKSPVEVMEGLLAHCPPVRSFQFHRHTSCSCRLLPLTIVYDRLDLLDLFLRRGADPNDDPLGKENYLYQEESPLECALIKGREDFVERLLREEELDLTIRPRLLNLWMIEYAHSLREALINQ